MPYPLFCALLRMAVQAQTDTGLITTTDNSLVVTIGKARLVLETLEKVQVFMRSNPPHLRIMSLIANHVNVYDNSKLANQPP